MMSSMQPKPADAMFECDPQEWRVGKLKKFLAHRGVDASSCIEKSELLALVVEQQGTSASASAPAHSTIAEDQD